MARCKRSCSWRWRQTPSPSRQRARARSSPSSPRADHLVCYDDPNAPDLHVWKSARSPTVGCTAMALDDLRALLAWVEPSTVLVQLPRGEYEARQRAWDLPPLADGQRK